MVMVRNSPERMTDRRRAGGGNPRLESRFGFYETGVTAGDLTGRSRDDYPDRAARRTTAATNRGDRYHLAGPAY